MGWYIYLVVALVQSHVQAYPTAEAPSGNSTLDIDVETKLNIDITNDQSHRANAKLHTNATVTILKPDGSNETAVSVNTNEVAPKNFAKAEFYSSNLYLNIKTKVYLEIPTKGEPKASTRTVAKIVTTDIDGDFANATAEITSDRDGNSTAKVNSTISSNGDKHSEEIETLNVFILTKYHVQLPRNGENLNAIANTTSEMEFIEVDGSSSSSVSYSVAEAGDDTTDDSATVIDLGNDRMEIYIKSKITVEIPHGGLPKADSKTHTDIMLINQYGSTSLTKTNAAVSIDDDSDDAAVNGSEAKVDDLPAKQEPAAKSDDVSAQGKETPEAKVNDSITKEDENVNQDDEVAQADAKSVATPDKTVAKPEESTVKPDESAAKPDKSAVKPDESTVKPDETAAKADESSTKPGKSGAESNVSTAKTDESAPKPDESAVKPDESVTKPDESAVKPDESAAKPSYSATASSVSTDESAPKPDETAIKPDESVAKPDEPAAKPNESAAKSNESSAKTDAPTTNADESAVKADESGTKPGKVEAEAIATSAA